MKSLPINVKKSRAKNGKKLGKFYKNINIKGIFYEEKEMQDIKIDFCLNPKKYNKNSTDQVSSLQD